MYERHDGRQTTIVDDYYCSVYCVCVEQTNSSGYHKKTTKKKDKANEKVELRKGSPSLHLPPQTTIRPRIDYIKRMKDVLSDVNK